MRYRPTIIATCLALALPGAAAAQGAGGDSTILGSWRITRTRVAPWVRQARSVVPSRAWVGRTVTFAPGRVTGPGVLDCRGARYRPTHVPAAGLFQGSLRAPTADAADLGIVVLPAPGVRLSCSTGVFELHRADAATLLLGLDNRIYTLDRSPGTQAPDTSPAGLVQRLLEQHFAGSMAFDSAHVASKAKWLSSRLRERIAEYFARPVDPGVVPHIDGDPFTDSQEPPTRFSVSLGTVRGQVVEVPVRFGFERGSRVVMYLLRRENGGWRIDDLRFQRRGSLSRLLQ